jgi:molybdopterin/thiamine biosynthesis adenylyltransferase/rhodanese-related sulfurtransferase
MAEEAARAVCPDRPLIDIRTTQERQLGVPGGASLMAADDLLDQCSREPRTASRGGFVICAEGVRSKSVVLQLRKLGYAGFSSVAGGVRAWAAAGLPLDYPAGLNASQAERYARHLVMPQVSSGGQRKLLDSRILLVGMGGLNSPVALYLAAAGIGSLGLVDFDSVERSNLQRQVIHGEGQLGRLKTESARLRIEDLNPDVQTVVYDQEVTAANAEALLESWDMVVDGTDNFSSRYALNDACIRQGKPLVYGAVMRFQGQVSVFWPSNRDHGPAPCFRCMIPVEPAAGETPSCAEAGVLGVLPGFVGTLQANEALKLALGIGQPLLGRLLMIDALNMDFRKTRIPVNPGCVSCGL